MHTRETVSLDLEKDADLITWLKRQDNKSAAIRAAIRAQFERHAEYTQGDVMRRLDDLMRRLDEIERNGVTVSVTPGADGEEPQEAAAALEGLGL